MFFLGAAPGVAARAAAILEQKHPGLLKIETMEAGPHPEQAGQIIERVRAARANILLVAFGAPTQELWIDRYRDDLRVPVMMGVGGAFDFVAGVTPRAPLWAQRLGLEWLHRLWMQPWRWRRMLALPRFAWAILIRSNAIWTA
jgi:N-acetylglucosaminyldiphosphoundecaprenol N-acetyl-beta-D-mannosaminyltransferase